MSDLLFSNIPVPSSLPPTRGGWKTVKEYIVLIGTSLLMVFLVRTFVAQPFVVNGSSMEPNFHTGEYLIVDQLSYELGDPHRGDVIIFHYPIIPSRYFIKRVIALPGETIKITGTKVEIKEVGKSDFYTLDEPYLEFIKEGNTEVTLANDEYFVMGDNRPASLDSRSWGPLNKSFVVGKAFVRLFPFSKIDFFPGSY
jgi:signal peptidase I